MCCEQNIGSGSCKKKIWLYCYEISNKENKLLNIREMKEASYNNYKNYEVRCYFVVFVIDP